MGIFRSNDPSVFDEIDGIIVDESAPAPSIQGVRTNIAILVGQFASGPVNVLTSVGSIGEVQELFGKSNVFGGNIALKNKKFGSLRIIRAAAAAAAKGTITFDDGDVTDVITFTAKYPGARGNSITVTVAAGSSSGSKYTVKDTHASAVLPTEVYDNVEIDAIAEALPFANSKLVDVSVDSASDGEPAAAAATNLASGSDGTIADTDYENAIAIAEQEGAGNILFLDDYNATRNGYLKTHAASTQDKMVIMAGAEGDSVSTTTTAVATLRDTDGRLIYAANWAKTSVGGVQTWTSPASWLASVMSQTHPSIDPAYAKNTQYLGGITALKQAFTRSNYIALKEAGVCALEYDQDIGFKFKSGIVTQIADSSKLTILRRRMADFLTASAARYLKNYQNAPNTKGNRDSVAAALRGFIAQQEILGVLPKDSEVKEGLAKLVDTDSLNTDLNVAQGYFYVLWKQRIYSSMRFIVLRAEIGESVSVTEG